MDGLQLHWKLMRSNTISCTYRVSQKTKNIDFFRFGNSGHFLAILGTFGRSGHFLTFLGTLGTFGHFWPESAQTSQTSKILSLTFLGHPIYILSMHLFPSMYCEKCECNNLHTAYRACGRVRGSDMTGL